MAAFAAPRWASFSIRVLLIVILIARHYAASSNSCNVSNWEDVIDRDLELLTKSTIHAAVLQGGRLQCHGGWIVTIYDNEVYAEPFGKLPKHKKPSQLDLVVKALCHYKFPNVNFILNAYERKAATEARKATLVFSSSKDPTKEQDVLLPHHSLAYLYSTRNSLQGSKPFEQRLDKAVWRGGASGGSYNQYTWRHTIRSRAVAACQKRQDICDAGRAAASHHQ